MNKQLPLIELRINPEDDSLVNAISLVESPAVESSFIAFNKQINFSTEDEKRELLGVAMVPDQQIYRNKPFEYMAVFSKDTIREIALVFASKGFFNNTNIGHSVIPADSVIFQSYITDEAKGITAPKGLGSVPDGSWIVGLKVQSQKTWNLIKSGEINGFSVEGIFQFIDTNMTVDMEYSKHLKELEDLEKIINSMR